MADAEASTLPVPAAAEDAAPVAAEPEAAEPVAAEPEAAEPIAAEPEAAAPAMDTEADAAAGGAGDAEEDKEAEPEAGSRGKRSRKKVERLEYDEAKKDKPAFEVQPGPGVEIGTLENIAFMLEKTKAVDLKPVHGFLFGVAGQKKDAKKNIRMFSGFPDTSAEEAAKKTDWLDKKVTHQLKFIAEVLDVQCSGSKASIIEALMDFAKNPKDLGNDNLKEQKAAARSDKKRKAEKKATAKAKKSAKKAKAKTKGKKKTGASKKKAADPVDEPDKPKSAKMFYAIEVRKEVLAKNKGKSKPELMMIIKKQYSALTDAKKKKYITMETKDQKRFEKETAEYEASLLEFDEEDLEDDDEEDDEDEDEDEDEEESEDDEPAPKKKKKSAPKDDDEDEDEPLVSSNKTPTDAEIKKAIARIIKKTADLADLTKRKVIEAVKAQYPVAELDEKKTLMRETIGAEVAKRVAEDEESD